MLRIGRLALVVGVVVGLGASAQTAAAQDVTTYTLDEVHRMAMGNYETVRAARERIDQARLLRRQATAVVRPTVSITGVTTRNFISEAFEFGGRTIQVIPPTDYNLAMVVSQPIYAGLRDLKAKRQADLGIQIAGETFGATAQDALLEVTRAYYQLLASQENVEISRRAVTVAEETLRTAESLYRAGEAVETAVLRARVASSDARRELLESENAVAIGEQQLSLLAGVPPGFRVTRPPRPAPFGRPIEELVKTGRETRAELQAMALQRGVAELEVEKRQGQHMPVIRAEGTYLRRRSAFPSNQLSSVAVTATWTIFDGGRTGAEIATAQSELREVTLRQELLRKQTEQQIRSAYLTVETLSASVDMLTAQVDFAGKNAESTARAYRVGEATDLDLLEANTTLTRSERQLAVNTYRLEVAMYELQRAVGTFGADLVARNTAGSGGTE